MTLLWLVIVNCNSFSPDVKLVHA